MMQNGHIFQECFTVSVKWIDLITWLTLDSNVYIVLIFVIHMSIYIKP